MRAMRPLSAPKRSASIATLLALGSAAVSVMHHQPADRSAARPSARAASRQREHQQRVQEQLDQRQRHDNVRRGVRVCACWPARHSTAPMVNSATGVAASASILITVVDRAARAPVQRAERAAQRDRPRQRVGERAAQRAQRRRRARRRAAPPACASAMHSELVTNMSTRMVAIIGPRPRGAEQRDQQRHAHEAGVRERGDQRAERRVLQPCTASSEKAIATKPPSAARTADRPRARPDSAARASGVFRPKRNSMHGSAKYSTKALSPGIADSGSTWRRPPRSRTAPARRTAP